MEAARRPACWTLGDLGGWIWPSAPQAVRLVRNDAVQPFQNFPLNRSETLGIGRPAAPFLPQNWREGP